MRSFPYLACSIMFFLSSHANLFAQQTSLPKQTPLRVGIVGLVHGHVQGFLEHALPNAEIELVGIAEPNRSLASRYAIRYHLDSALLFPSLEEMLERKRPQAVLVYTNTFDHRKVVEICARHGVHVMMEKPLAVSLADAWAIKKAADAGKIHVLVNYERQLGTPVTTPPTTWFTGRRLGMCAKSSSTTVTAGPGKLGSVQSF